jgi:hypothetical protein
MNKKDADINGKFRSEYPVYDMKNQLPGSVGGLIVEYQLIPWFFLYF